MFVICKDIRTYLDINKLYNQGDCIYMYSCLEPFYWHIHNMYKLYLCSLSSDEIERYSKACKK